MYYTVVRIVHRLPCVPYSGTNSPSSSMTKTKLLVSSAVNAHASSKLFNYVDIASATDIASVTVILPSDPLLGLTLPPPPPRHPPPPSALPLPPLATPALIRALDKSDVVTCRRVRKPVRRWKIQLNFMTMIDPAPSPSHPAHSVKTCARAGQAPVPEPLAQDVGLRFVHRSVPAKGTNPGVESPRTA